jgi:hypothetical protein
MGVIRPLEMRKPKRFELGLCRSLASQKLIKAFGFRRGVLRGHPVKLRRTISHAASNPFVSGEA